MIIDCLIVKEKWLELILSGKKCLEIRGSRTTKRGLIGLIQSGSGEIKGFANLTISPSINQEFYEQNKHLHCIENMAWEDLPYKNPHAWVLKDVIKLKEPIKYRHPQGAVIWVKVDLPVEVKDGEVYYNQRRISA